MRAPQVGLLAAHSAAPTDARSRSLEFGRQKCVRHFKRFQTTSQDGCSISITRDLSKRVTRRHAEREATRGQHRARRARSCTRAVRAPRRRRRRPARAQRARGARRARQRRARTRRRARAPRARHVARVFRKCAEDTFITPVAAGRATPASGTQRRRADARGAGQNQKQARDAQRETSTSSEARAPHHKKSSASTNTPSLSCVTRAGSVRAPRGRRGAARGRRWHLNNIYVKYLGPGMRGRIPGRDPSGREPDACATSRPREV